MALSPLQQNSSDRAEVIETVVQPSKTYKFDFDTGEFTGEMIDEEEALRQFIVKAIFTARDRFLIYDSQYGSEVESLVAEDLPFEIAQMEIKRFITEALIYDERISEVGNFTFEQVGDKVHVTFQVISNQGIVIGEEVII